MIINLLVDNPSSWIVPYVKILFNELSKNHRVNFVHNSSHIIPGDCAFFLSCEKIVNKEIMARNKHNLVVHESYLPEGKGWSPLTWQILEGKSEIPLTLFEATEKVDSGDIYIQDTIIFKGHELIDELHEKQGNKTIEMIMNFLDFYPKIMARKQSGQQTFYAKRTPQDSRLDPKKTIEEQFGLLRVVDNDRYPAFFNLKGHKYILKIFKEE